MTGKHRAAGRAPRRWWVVRLTVPRALADEVSGVLGADTLGVEVRDVGDGDSQLHVYTSSREAAARKSGEAHRTLPEVWGLDPVGCATEISSVEDDRWVERYQASLGPLPLGRRFVVIRRGESAACGAGRMPVRLVPGRAFGTGEHPTTRLCVSALERWVRPGARWLDVGTGSGILAVVAALLGAAKVRAVDRDPDAVEAAWETVRANGQSGIVDVREGSPGRFDEASVDGVVANVDAGFFSGHARALRLALRPGGVLLASGFPVEDVEGVERSLADAALRSCARLEEGGWACAVARSRRP